MALDFKELLAGTHFSGLPFEQISKITDLMTNLKENGMVFKDTYQNLAHGVSYQGGGMAQSTTALGAC